MQIGNQDYPFIHNVSSPIPIDLDRIYIDDIDVDACSFSAGWTSMDGGTPDILSLFDGDRTTGIKNATTNTPKWFIVMFKKVLVTNTAGFYTYGGLVMSNGKLEIITGNNIYTTLADESTISTKVTTKTLQLPVTAGFSGIKVSFVTANTDIGISGCILLKMLGTVSRIQATNLIGTVDDIYANTNHELMVCSTPFMASLSRGYITGKTPWSKIGFNPSITTSEEIVWSQSGAFVFPTVAMQMELVSSSATADADIGTILFNATCDAGGTTTTMLDAGVDFTATAAIGDYIIIDKSGTTPEWGIITAVANGSVTFAGGLSSGGSCATARTYQILDTSAATGAMACLIQYLDGSYVAKTEIVILNTSTAVATVNTNLFRINGLRVIATGKKSGYTSTPVGNISLRHIADTPIYTYITAGFTRARNSVYTVPYGKTLYINSIFAGASTPNDTKVQTIRLFLKASVEPSTNFKGSGDIFFTYSEMLISNAQILNKLDIPIKIPATCDLYFSAVGATGFSGAITTDAYGWLE